MAKRIVIIGGGPAGYEAAIAGARYGAEVTLVEKRRPGGSAVLLDCVPSKSFIAGANVRTDMRRADDMGIPAVVGEFRGQPDIGPLNTRVTALAADQSDDVHEQLQRSGVEMLRGTARLEGNSEQRSQHRVRVSLKTGGEEIIDSDLVLISTGASPRVLPGAQPDGDRILTWQQIYGLTEMPKHLIVVGSGVTGAEMVSAFSELGVKVTMVASGDRILPHDDADAADVLETVLAERGVSLVKRAYADTVVNTGSGVVVTTSDGRTIEGSHALMTVGSVPQTKNIGLEEAGVEMTKSGHIVVDRVSRTSVPGIYAGGDCTNIFPLASVAEMQGRIAIYHSLGEGVSPLRLKTVATAVFTRPEIAMVGVTHAQIESGEVPIRAITLPLHTNPRAKMRALRHGFVKLYCRKNSGLVVGGVIVAPNASELILPISMAVANNLTVADLAQTFAVYPSLSGTITEAARRLGGYDDLE